MSWESLLDFEIFDLSTLWGIGDNGYSVTIPSSGLGELVPLAPSQMGTIKTLYAGLTQLPTETWGKASHSYRPLGKGNGRGEST